MSAVANFHQSITLLKAFREGVSPKELHDKLIDKLKNDSFSLLNNVYQNQMEVKEQMDLMVGELKKIPSVESAKNSLTILQDVSRKIDESAHLLKKEAEQTQEKLLKQKELKDSSLRVLTASKQIVEAFSSISKSESFVYEAGNVAIKLIP